MRSWLLIVLGILFSTLVIFAMIYTQRVLEPEPHPISTLSPLFGTNPSTTPVPLATPSHLPLPSDAPSPLPSSPNLNSLASNPNPDLTVDTNGLSKATVIINTSAGVIKFKFYPNDAPKTVKRLIELIQKGFYNGLIFHRVLPGFVIQGGDPTGNGTGGSGQKLDAEFNNRRHVEGALAMARAADPNSADSQFYISLGTHPHLDHNYTVFGQVIEGMDIAKKIKVGDKIMVMIVQ